MPNIPTTDAYISSQVSHNIPKLAPELDINIADPLYRSRIDNLKSMEKAVVGAIDHVKKVNEEFMEERQNDIDFQSLLDYQVVDAQKSVEFKKQLADTPDPDQYDGMYKRFHEERVSRVNEYSGKVSKKAWVKLTGDMWSNYAQEYPMIATTAIRKRRENTLSKTLVTIKGTINYRSEDPLAIENTPTYRMESIQGVLFGAVEAKVMSPEKADIVRRDAFNQIAVNENLADAASRPSAFRDKEEKDKYLLDEYLTVQDRAAINREREHQAYQLKQNEALQEEQDWQTAHGVLNKGEYFKSPQEIKMKFPALQESQVQSMFQASQAKERGDSARVVELDNMKQSEIEVKRFLYTYGDVMNNTSNDRISYIAQMQRASYLPVYLRRVIMAEINKKVGGAEDKLPPDIKSALSTSKSDLHSLWMKNSSRKSNRFATIGQIDVVEGGWFSTGSWTAKQDYETQAKIMERYIKMNNDLDAIANKPGMTVEALVKEYTKMVTPIKTQSLKMIIEAGGEQ